jgi:hypothetical protein
MAICGNTKLTVGSGQGKGTAIVANYYTKLCPICLEYFDNEPWDEMGEASPGGNNNAPWQSSRAMKQVDSHGIPT